MSKNLIETESSDSNTGSELSGICQSINDLMAELGHCDPIIEEVVPEHQPTAKEAERFPKEEWSKMTKSQRRNYLRRRGGARGGAGTSVEYQREEGGGKRPREVAGLTPSPAKGDRKKPKLDGPKYSQVVSCIKVAIMHQDYPKEELPEDVCEELLGRLVDEMGEAKLKEVLTFHGFNYRAGAIVINCANDYSRSWITEHVAKLSPWQGRPLKIGDPKMLEGFVRIGTFVPKPVRNMEAAMKNIKTQNEINTDHWRVLPGGSKMQPKGLFFVASIPESHFRTIEARNFKLSHGFHVIDIKPMKKKERKEQSKMEVEEERQAPSGGGEKESVVAAEEVAADQSGDRSVGDTPSDRSQPLDGRCEPVVDTSTSAGLSEAGGQACLPQPLDGRRGSVSGAARRDTASGAAAGGAVGKNRDSRGRLGGAPPPT